jgi:hypothetical protein
LCFTYESWNTKLVERVEALDCEASLGAIFVGFLGVVPLHIRGIRGTKSTPRIGWEVSVKSLCLERGSKEGAQVFGGYSQVSISIGSSICISSIFNFNESNFYL